jgi:hypothetical protein
MLAPPGAVDSERDVAACRTRRPGQRFRRATKIVIVLTARAERRRARPSGAAGGTQPHRGPRRRSSMIAGSCLANLLSIRGVPEEIAQSAARLIAEDGLDYASAKRKAARQLFGDTRVAGEWLPDNDLIEEELREYIALFQSDTQPDELRRLREAALDWMRRLAEFNPYVTGAVLNGTANAHSDIHLQIFTDNPKDVAIYLLNQNVQYDVSETRHFAGRADVETLSFLWRPRRDMDAIGVHVALYASDDLRGAVKADARARRAGRRRRVARCSKPATRLPNRNDSTMMMKRMLAVALVAAAAIGGGLAAGHWFRGGSADATVWRPPHRAHRPRRPVRQPGRAAVGRGAHRCGRQAGDARVVQGPEGRGEFLGIVVRPVRPGDAGTRRAVASI